MAKYTFKCNNCGETREQFCSPRIVSGICKICGAETQRLLPKMNGPAVVYEDPDGVSGHKWIAEHNSEIQARKRKYYFEVEVPRMVESGTYSLETMIEQGWVWIDDNGEMHMHTKPPEMR